MIVSSVISAKEIALRNLSKFRLLSSPQKVSPSLVHQSLSFKAVETIHHQGDELKTFSHQKTFAACVVSDLAKLQEKCLSLSGSFFIVLF